ncbi:EAL domain-containing protein [Lysobacter koreensis]|uniref:EAL domain-containing protein n=1 Tax=Lysobacter koreensis TaxID=266122 RepID=A0ABW2YL91_9GAMM
MPVRPYSSLIAAAGLIATALLLGPGLAPRAEAATREFYFERVGRGQGLAQNTVNALAQDSQGFVWVGTQGGLHRYDGQRYVLYRHDPRDPASLPDSYVTALALEADRALWIGTYSQYVARLDLGNGRIRRYKLDNAGSHASQQAVAVLPLAGQVWVGTLAGLQRLDPDSGERATLVQLDPRRQRELPWQTLIPGRDRDAWYGSPVGLFHIDARGSLRRVGPIEPVRSLRLDHRGQLWVGRTDGLYRLHSNGAALLKAWPAANAPADAGGDIRAIAEAPDRRLWLSVYGQGLRRYDPASGASKGIREEHGIDASLPEDTINALMVDRGGMLWVGGQFRGVAIADPRGTRFSYVLDLASGRADNVAADDSVRAVADDGLGGLWLGTDNARLLRYDLGADRFDDLTSLLPSTPRPGHPLVRVMGIAPAGHGRLWLATTHGLVRLDPAARRAEPIALGAMTGASLRSLAVDRHGDLWLGTSTQGALHYRRQSGQVVHYSHADGDPRRLSHPMVHAVHEDRRGRIWFGTGDGLDLLDPATGTLRHFRHATTRPDSLPGNLVRALSQSPDGTVWVGTHAGLSRVIEHADGRIGFAHPLADSLGEHAVPVVYSIAEAPAGQLWLGTDNGIVRFDTSTQLSRNYGLTDGLQDTEFNGGAVARLKDGRLAFGGVRGLNLFHPERVSDSRYTPPVRLLSARIGADAPGDGGALWQPSQLEVPDGADILRLRIGALDFAPSANLHYRYRMDGFDQGWIDNGTQHDVSYTRLPPGEYTFRAQVTNRDGAWTGQELTLPVRVAPPVWRHPLALAAAALAFLVFALVMVRRWRLRRERERGYFEQIREREERLKLALWASGEQFWDYDLATGTLHRMRADDRVGPTPVIGVHTQLDTSHEIHPEDAPRVLELLRQHLRGDVALFQSEHRIRDPAGQWAWMRARGRVVERGPDGRGLRVAGTARDITASRSAERERRVSSEVLRSMAEAVAVFDRHFVFISVNPAFTRMAGYSDAEVIGRSTSLIDSSQHDNDFYRQMRAELERNGRWSGEVWQQRKDGSEFLCWVQASAVLDAQGQRSHFVAVLSDITDQKRAEQELRYLANYDTLTSLPNRALLSERLSRAIVRARRNGTRIAVLFLDLDRFKDINDSLGHAAGDRILRAAAARLQQTVGPEHTVARLGGDEFTVVLEDVATAEDAEQVARDLITAFEAPLDFDERHDMSISPSIGISLYPDHAHVPTDLLKHADTAMYQAKAAGRRTFMRYTESMDIEIRGRATISAALRKVLDRNELRLVFQPRLSLPDSRITGVEALLRWTSAEHGEIPPSTFIPLAEENGLILEIGEWVLRQACAVLRQWRQQGLLDLTMAVNVSALQLLRGDLPDVVARVLDETGVPAECLELELTESVIMANAEQTAATLQAFRTLGVGLAVDDFGTGYSSLAYLKRLPITTLKIDKEFIGDLTHDPDDAAITSTVITMAHSLGLVVVAEGVETAAQMQFLREHHCDEIQGYWLARPLDAAHCLAFIHGWAPPQPVAVMADATP